MKRNNFSKTMGKIRRKESKKPVRTERRNDTEYCQWIEEAVNDFVAKGCNTKSHKLDNCEDETGSGCDCSGASSGLVDLVLLIDSSGSMSTKAAAVNAAAEAAIENAKSECGADPRITWLFVDGARPGSSPGHALGSGAGNFTQSHQEYLEGIGATGPFYHDQPDTGLIGQIYVNCGPLGVPDRD